MLCVSGVSLQYQKFWHITEVMTFGGIILYFDSWESLSYNDIHSKIANQKHCEFNQAAS